MTATEAVSAESAPRIMIVEDERIVAMDLAETLGELGYAIAGVTTRGEEAIELARQVSPQLILMDVRLAGEIDGIAAAETIRAERDVPVVYLTAHSDNETLRRATQSDPSAYLVKPFKSPELRCVIEIALHKHAMDERLHEQMQQIQRLNEGLEQRVLQRTAALAAANQELEAFSYSVAHDLRAPLRGIDSFSQLLIERHSQHLNAEGVAYLNRVRGAVGRMSQLIDALLSLAQVGQSQLLPIDLDFSHLVRSVATEIAAAHPDRKVTMQTAPDLQAYGDARLLRIVVANLLENAWKFTARRAHAMIEVGASRATAVPTYYVRDNGAGFDPTHAQKLFGAFQRLHTDKEFPGTGIGLAIVQRVIVRHGGTIWAESLPEQGATFYFTLPAAAIDG
jgi:two-component system, sensor histidine kinase and response regulator